MVNAYSPDGIHWSCSNKAVVLYGPDVADASTVLGWDPKRRKYVGYYRPGHPLAHEITWEDADLSRLQGEAVRLRLEIRNACLYSIQFLS